MRCSCRVSFFDGAFVVFVLKSRSSDLRVVRCDFLTFFCDFSTDRFAVFSTRKDPSDQRCDIAGVARFRRSACGLALSPCRPSVRPSKRARRRPFKNTNGRHGAALNERAPSGMFAIKPKKRVTPDDDGAITRSSLLLLLLLGLRVTPLSRLSRASVWCGIRVQS